MARSAAGILVARRVIFERWYLASARLSPLSPLSSSLILASLVQYFAENAPQTTSEPVSLTTSPPISPTTTTTTTTTTTPSASRMPPLLDTGDPDSDAPLDSRSSHPFLQSTPPSDMDVTFIGTASCSPSFTRGVSCTALRITSNERGATTLGGTWLFDAGEGTQLQLQASPVTKSKISKIFITHAHGDHTFGLPGLLCFLGMDRDRTVEPAIEIYGPEGLREWLRATVRCVQELTCKSERVLASLSARPRALLLALALVFPFSSSPRLPPPPQGTLPPGSAPTTACTNSKTSPWRLAGRRSCRGSE